MTSATLEAARSSTRGSGWALSGPGSSWECCAAQRHQTRPEEAQTPSWGRCPGVTLTMLRDRHAAVVLGGRTDHGGPTDVDVLDAVGEGRALGDGGAEGVQVDHDDLDRLAAQLQQEAVAGGTRVRMCWPSLGTLRVGLANLQHAVGEPRASRGAGVQGRRGAGAQRRAHTCSSSARSDSVSRMRMPPWVGQR